MKQVILFGIIECLMIVGLLGAVHAADELVVDENGKVGIGTTMPRSQLHLSVSGNQPTSFTSETAGALSIWGGDYVVNGYTNLDFGSNVAGDPIGRIGVRNNGGGSYLTFGTSNHYADGITNEALIINPKGEVGIGIKEPRSRLHLVDSGGQTTSFTGNYAGTLSLCGGSYVQDGYTNLDFSNNGAGSVIGRIGVRNNGGGSYLTFGTSSSYAVGITNEALVINPSGRVGIGYISPLYKLDVNGIIRGTNVSPSDVRWKENVNPIEDSLELISQLRGVTYEWTDKSKGEGQHLGVIAQEVEEVFPQVVHTDSQGYKSVEYSKLVAPLIEAVKELNIKNERINEDNISLKTENRQLQNRCLQLELRLAKIEAKLGETR